MVEHVAAAGERGERARELQRLERRQAARRPLEQNSRENLVLRQARVGGDRERGLRRRARYADARGHAARGGLGDEVEIGHPVAVKLDAAAREDELLAEKRERALQEMEAAGHWWVRGRPGHAEIAAELRVDAAPVDEDPVGGGDREVERRVERRRS